MRKASIEQHPDWPELRDDIEDLTLRVCAKFLALCEKHHTFVSPQLADIAGKLNCRNINRLLAHIDAFSRTQLDFVEVCKDLLVAAEKASAQRKGQLQ